MTDPKITWAILWDHASRVRGPFELADVLPEIARAQGTSEADAKKATSRLIGELVRLPVGRRYFTIDGNAVVPLPAFLSAPKGPEAARTAYPFEV